MSITPNTKDIGELSEAMVLASLLRAGKKVLKPFGDNLRYDLVIDENGSFKRIQVKTGRVTPNGGIEFSTCSSYAHRGRGKKDYRGQADLFGVYVKDFAGKVFLIPVEDVPRSQGHLRIFPQRNSNGRKPLWAKDYELIIQEESKLDLKLIEQQQSKPMERSSVSISKRKFNPSKEELEEKLKTHTMVALGKHYGVSNNAVKRRAKIFGLFPKKKEQQKDG